jgi:hypothetical protein
VPADDGKRIVKETIWQAGVVNELTELYFEREPQAQRDPREPEAEVGEGVLGHGQGVARGGDGGLRRALGWWESGRAETVAAYADDKMTEAKTWDRDGKLVADDQFEADGSRKIKR